MLGGGSASNLSVSVTSLLVNAALRGYTRGVTSTARAEPRRVLGTSPEGPCFGNNGNRTGFPSQGGTYVQGAMATPRSRITERLRPSYCSKHWWSRCGLLGDAD